ncbi:MAG: hypothetical protein JWN78_111 [Bacteroidota bacterium]|nr:hypothetical protein [Bacteroidota bacterium]
MKRIILHSFLFLLVTCIMSCSKNSSTNPATFTIPFAKCKLVNYEYYNSIVGTTDTGVTTYHGDSIINVLNSSGSTFYSFFIIDKTHKRIVENDYDNSLSNLAYTSTYYLSGGGLIDSIIRVQISSGMVDYKDYITRNSAGKVVHEITDYITYGYDDTYTYDSNGNVAYKIEVSTHPGGTYNDSILYTYTPQVYSGEPFYITDDIDGSTSRNLPASRTVYNRATLAVKRYNTFIYVFDSQNKVVQRAQVNTIPSSYTLVENFQHDCN